MIQTMIFDLDGTLVQTEKLKALSYAKAAVFLRPDLVEEEVIAAFQEVVGLSRREVARYLTERFDLADTAVAHLEEFAVIAPWQAYVQIRLRIYEAMLADSNMIRRNQWPHNMALLQEARRNCRYVALATMSHCPQAQHVLQILNLAEAFDFIATRDDVTQGKPNPEIYTLTAQELGVAPAECLVVEDSPAGVQAALAAGMNVVAVATLFTRQRLHEAALLPDTLIVDDPARLTAVVARILQTTSS